MLIESIRYLLTYPPATCTWLGFPAYSILDQIYPLSVQFLVYFSEFYAFFLKKYDRFLEYNGKNFTTKFNAEKLMFDPSCNIM